MQFDMHYVLSNEKKRSIKGYVSGTRRVETNNQRIFGGAKFVVAEKKETTNNTNSNYEFIILATTY